MKAKVDCLQHGIQRLRISICAGVNMKNLSFLQLELEWHSVFVFLDRVITLKLIHATCAFGIAWSSLVSFSLGLHRACKTTLLVICAVLYVAFLESWGNQGDIWGGGPTRFALYNI